MNTGHGMIWPLAAEYARRGWAVRRAGWANVVTNPFNQANSLRWIIHHSGLFHLTYYNRGDDFLVGPVTRVVRNTDFGVDEFHADDWTVFPPGCSASPASDQQGKQYYPYDIDDEPFFDPAIPGGGGESCPVVPPIVDPPPPTCGGLCLPPPLCGTNFKLATGGFDSCGCRIYICQPTFCPYPPTCPPGSTARISGFNDLGCAIWICAPDDRQPCGDPPACGPNTKLVVGGSDSRGCPLYLCQPIFCVEPPLCPPGQRLVVIGEDDAGCPLWGCRPGDGPCGDPPRCGPGLMLVQTGVDANGCATFECRRDDDGGGGGGDDGGGGGGGGGGNRRPPRPQPNRDPAQITIEDVTWTPQCFPENSPPPFQIQLGFRVRLGPAPTSYAQGLYWISIWVHGQRIDAPSWTPGTAVDYSVPVQQSPGKSTLIRANAYLPIKRIQSNDRHEFDFPEFCKKDGCTNPHAANYDPQATEDDGSCVTCASTGNCDPYDTDEGENCNDAGNGCCDGYCETANDCSPSFRGSFTATNGTYYPSCFG